MAIHRVKFLHCADLHLDAPFASLGEETGKSSIRRQDLKITFERIIELARLERVDLLLIGGDLFEHDYIRKSTLLFLRERLGSVAPVKVIIVPGNHDPYLVNSIYKSVTWSDNVHILGGDKPRVFLEELKTWVYGVGFDNFHGEGILPQELGEADQRYINILLFHGTVDMSIGRNAYNSVSSAELASLGMDYIALGHFHNRIDDLGGHGNIYNPGSPEPLGFDETGDHGVFLGELKKEGCSRGKLDIRFLKTAVRSYKVLDADVSGASADHQVIARIESAIKAAQEEGALYSVTLGGRIEPGFSIELTALQRWFADRLFYIRFKNETVEDYDLEQMAGEYGLRGLFVRKMLDRIGKAADEKQKQLLTRALYYGIEALGPTPNS